MDNLIILFNHLITYSTLSQEGKTRDSILWKARVVTGDIMAWSAWSQGMEV